jgi:hypothetical protein
METLAPALASKLRAAWLDLEELEAVAAKLTREGVRAAEVTQWIFSQTVVLHSGRMEILKKAGLLNRACVKWVPSAWSENYYSVNGEYYRCDPGLMREFEACFPLETATDA